MEAAAQTGAGRDHVLDLGTDEARGREGNILHEWISWLASSGVASMFYIRHINFHIHIYI